MCGPIDGFVPARGPWRENGIVEGDPLEIIGDVIDGQFRVDSFVGLGDLSIVYRGFHVGVEAEVAIKFLDLPTTLDAKLVEPLVKSFREGSKLHYRLARGHMNIAQSIASGQTLAPRTGVVVPYLIREWLEGSSLAHDFADRRARGLRGRSPVETRELFTGALDGLSYAHRQGVAHLGLNPTNLFVTQSDGEVRLKILDFGVAHAMNEHAGPVRAQKSPQVVAQTGLRILVPAYAAPEQLDAAVGRAGPATDVYAMALMIVEALDDAPVFPDAPPTLDRDLKPDARKITLPASLDPRVTAVLERALTFLPRDRYPSAGVFWKELGEVLPQRGGAIVRRPSGSLKMPPRERAHTLLGLNVPGPDLSSSPPAAPSRPPQAAPVTASKAPPLPAAAWKAPSQPPPALKHPSQPPPKRPSVRPLPPQQAAARAQPAPQLRVATPIAEPMYVETIARAKESAMMRAAAPAPQQAAASHAAPMSMARPMMAAPPPQQPPPPVFPTPVPVPFNANAPLIPPAPPVPRALAVPPTPPMPMAPPSFTTPPPFAQVDPSRTAETMAPPGFGSSRAKLAVVSVIGVAGAIGVVLLIASATAKKEPAARAATSIPAASAAPVAAAASARPVATAMIAPSSLPAIPTATSVAAVSTADAVTLAAIPPSNDASSASRSKPKHRFFVHSGRVALDEAGATLGECKRPHGHTGAGEVRVTFMPSTGRVIHIQIGPPYAGSEQGKCIVAKLREAQVDPFRGPPSAINYVFRIPR